MRANLTTDLRLTTRLFAALREKTFDGVGITREAYGPGEQIAHALVREEAAALGLDIDTDAAGNPYEMLVAGINAVLGDPQLGEADELKPLADHPDVREETADLPKKRKDWTERMVQRYNRSPNHSLHAGGPMPTLAPFTAVVLALSLGAAQAATPAADDKPTDLKSAQQNRMRTCSADARLKELKGVDRKAFMSECLRKKA